MPRQGYKSVTLPEPTYRMIVEIRKELAKKGLSSIPEEVWKLVETEKCPRCGTAMDKIELKASYYRCPKCGFEKPEVRLEAVGSFALGAIIGFLLTLGVAYLFQSMSKTFQRENYGME